MQRGSTLFELVIVIAIFAIVAAFAIPRLGESLAKRDLDNAARQLVGDIRWAQQLAVNSLEGEQPKMKFYELNSRYHYAIYVGTKAVRPVVTLPVTVRISNKVDIDFRMDGKIVTGASIILQSTVNPTLFRTIRIQMLTGRVRLE